MTLDKLEAVPSEAALVERALELISEHRVWAGIVFLGPEDFSGPGHVRIKIRMDIDDVTRTNNIRDRWGPCGAGPREWWCQGASHLPETLLGGAQDSLEQFGFFVGRAYGV